MIIKTKCTVDPDLARRAAQNVVHYMHVFWHKLTSILQTIPLERRMTCIINNGITKARHVIHMNKHCEVNIIQYLNRRPQLGSHSLATKTQFTHGILSLKNAHCNVFRTVHCLNQHFAKIHWSVLTLKIMFWPSCNKASRCPVCMNAAMLR